MSRVRRALSSFCEAHQSGYGGKCKARLVGKGLCTKQQSDENDFCNEHQMLRDICQFRRSTLDPEQPEEQPKKVDYLPCNNTCQPGHRFCSTHDEIALQEELSDYRTMFKQYMEDWHDQKLTDARPFFEVFTAREHRLYLAHQSLPVGHMIWIINAGRQLHPDEAISAAKTPFCNGRSRRLYAPDTEMFTGGADSY